MDEPTIRRARRDDVETLARLGHATFQETFIEGFAIPYPPEDLETFLAASYAPGVFANKLADTRQATWIAEDGEGRALAYVNVGPCLLPHPDASADQGELYRLYVLKAAQGAGLGGRLLTLALDHMRTAMPGPQWIGVWSGNLKARRLYEAHGFREIGEYQFPVGKWRDDEVILRRG